MSTKRSKSLSQYESENRSPKIMRTFGYKFGKTLGKGTYSRVCVAADKKGERFACKIINKTKAGADFIKKFLPRELEIITAVHHPNIVTVFKIIEASSTIYMFMDYCRNGDLLEYIKSNGCFSEETARPLFKQIVSAIQYLHSIEIAHRDLKCENILLMWDNKVKLADFGFARSCVDKNGFKIYSDTFCGSAAYAAPEILQGIPYDPKTYDIWALGCILYIMLLATMPFDDSDVKKMLKVQKNKSVSKNATQWIKDSSLNLLLCNLLEPDVALRPQIKEISNCAWLKENVKRKKSTLETIYDSIFI